MKTGSFPSLLIIGLITLVTTTVTAADKQEPIGKITSLDKKYWAMRLSGHGGDRDAAVNGVIWEHDTIQTIAGQHVVVLLEDGTELLIGPSSRVTFKNWWDRDGDGRRVRNVYLRTGMMKAKVRKIYSQLEPFVVESKYGAVAVRGTEFVVEAGAAGRLGRLGQLTADERTKRSTEVEVHTLEGEVHLAKSVEELSSPESRVAITAGQTSLVRYSMALPQQPHAFDVAKYQSYVAKSAPELKVAVNRETTNEGRSTRSANATQEKDNISPAQPKFAKVKPNADAGGASRGIASVPSTPTSASEAVDARRKSRADSDEHDRRKEVGFETDSDRAVAHNRHREPATTDGVHHALEGSEFQTAEETHSGVDQARDNAPRFGDETKDEVRRRHPPQEPAEPKPKPTHRGARHSGAPG